jgi:hypothetical protein
MRQRAATISLTRASSSAVAGWWIAVYRATISSKLTWLSQERRIVLQAVRPWRRELREEISRVAADFGPWDLAPLARAVSDFNWLGVLSGMWEFHHFPIYFQSTDADTGRQRIRFRENNIVF